MCRKEVIFTNQLVLTPAIDVNRYHMIVYRTIPFHASQYAFNATLWSKNIILLCKLIFQPLTLKFTEYV